MFDRFELLVGEKINVLKSKTVLLIGLGGVGSYAFEALVRSGIGRIIIVDNDTIDITNLNRQMLALNTNIGSYKVDEAEKRKNLINKECQILKIKDYITKENINILFKTQVDFLVDAEDTLSTKKEIIKYCLKNNIKFISACGTGNKMDASKLEIIDVRHTSYDPIAKALRHFLKKENLHGKVPVVTSAEKPIKITQIGSNAFVPGTAGLLCASYAINELLKEEHDGKIYTEKN